MPRRKSLVTVIRDMVREQVQEAVQGLLGAVGGPKKRAKNGRRGKWRPGGPGRPPGSTAKVRRGPGRPPGSKTRIRRGPGRPPKGGGKDWAMVWDEGTRASRAGAVGAEPAGSVCRS